MAHNTDVSRPAALPTANLHKSHSIVDQDSNAYLDSIEEDWNKRVDAEIETLVDGMVDLVGLAALANKDKFRVAQEAFHTQSRVESMVRAANSLLSITHSMKLLLLLSDEAQIAHRRDAELKLIQQEKEATKAKVSALLTELLSKPSASSSSDAMDTTAS